MEKHGRQWLDFLRSRAELALAGDVVSTAEAAAWTGEIESGAREHSYLFAISQFVVSARVP